ncbi:hypothetical protein RFI_31653 [Reticulomyxa filosa]|uniref:Uncharacterized protein n=1 Tax=Reticulomyxa filosa TaxID=46433 RepID=X6LYD5_RETFI|nr:hypothetical protein RFI_31653 [Reticulomyxa filosa]|eukprot:ETO05745.1 hypothetical protein RFI_31653 [Reticulomyxa filosa]
MNISKTFIYCIVFTRLFNVSYLSCCCLPHHYTSDSYCLQRISQFIEEALHLPQNANLEEMVGAEKDNQTSNDIALLTEKYESKKKKKRKHKHKQHDDEPLETNDHSIFEKDVTDNADHDKQIQSLRDASDHDDATVSKYDGEENSKVKLYHILF